MPKKKIRAELKKDFFTGTGKVRIIRQKDMA